MKIDYASIGFALAGFILALAIISHLAVSAVVWWIV